jgi:hypothetical protein
MTGTEVKTQTLIAILVVVGFLAVIGAWFYFPIKGDTALFNVLVGLLGGGFTSVVQFFFGSSAGSKAKDSTIGAIALATPPASNANPTPAQNVTTLNRGAT